MLNNYQLNYLKSLPNEPFKQVKITIDKFEINGEIFEKGSIVLLKGTQAKNKDYLIVAENNTYIVKLKSGIKTTGFLEKMLTLITV